MPVIAALFRRDDNLDNDDSAQQSTYSEPMAKLVTALVVLMLAVLLMTGALFYLRQRRRRANMLRIETTIASGSPPMSPSSPAMQKNMGLRAPARPSHHRRTKSLTTPPDSPVFVVGDSDSLLDEKRIESGSHNGSVTRHDSVPEIHLTFPEEMNEHTGKRESKVVVVTVSEKGAVGLRPIDQEDAPPAYSERDMKSLDLERIGGLKEKN